MEKYEKIFFNILRSALWGCPVEIPEGFTRWNRIMSLAQNQALMGLVCDVLLTRPEIREKLSPKFVERLQDITLNSMGMHTQTNITLQLLAQTLREHGIEPVLLKGQGLAMYYSTPQVRQCGDIDLYVGEDNYEKAYDAILPIVSSIEDKSKIWDTMHFDASVGSIMVEIHHHVDIMYSRKNEKLYDEFMVEGTTKDLRLLKIGGVEVNTPNDTFNAFYVFYHLWRHFTISGVGLRQFCDLARFLHTNVGQIDLPRLKKMLDDLGFLQPWQVFGCFLVKDLGLPQDDFPFYTDAYVGKIDRVRKYVMDDGNFGINVGLNVAVRNGYLHSKWVSFKFHILRILRMFAIFPKHTILRLYYMLRDGFAKFFRELKK